MPVNRLLPAQPADDPSFDRAVGWSPSPPATADELVGQWRREAALHREQGHAALAVAKEGCAERLEAWLAAQREPRMRRIG